MNSRSGFSKALMLVIGGIIVIGVIVFLSLRKTTTDTNHSGMMSTDRLGCGSETHGHNGLLEAEFNPGNQLTGWKCTITSHDVCTAGADGIWTSCTYPPDRGWPAPVPQEALQNPTMYKNESLSESSSARR
jgi:hypothetical protein